MLPVTMPGTGLVSVAVLTVLVVSPAWGQHAVDRVPAQCAASAAQLSRATTDSQYRDGLVGLYACPVSGPAVLATQLRNSGLDSLKRELLSQVSLVVGDRRIYVAAKEITLDRTRSQFHRFMAMRVLVGQFNPQAIIKFHVPATPLKFRGKEDTTARWVGAASATVGFSTGSGYEGAEPISEAERRGVLETLRQLSEAQGDDRVIRGVALHVRKTLETGPPWSHPKWRKSGAAADES